MTQCCRHRRRHLVPHHFVYCGGWGNSCLVRTLLFFVWKNKEEFAKQDEFNEQHDPRRSRWTSFIRNLFLSLLYLILILHFTFMSRSRNIWWGFQKLRHDRPTPLPFKDQTRSEKNLGYNRGEGRISYPSLPPILPQDPLPSPPPILPQDPPHLKRTQLLTVLAIHKRQVRNYSRTQRRENHPIGLLICTRAKSPTPVKLNLIFMAWCD